MLAAASTFCSSDAYCFNKNQETFYDVNSKNFNNSVSYLDIFDTNCVFTNQYYFLASKRNIFLPD